jgi:hypothetical protein
MSDCFLLNKSLLHKVYLVGVPQSYDCRHFHDSCSINLHDPYSLVIIIIIITITITVIIILGVTLVLIAVLKK